MSLFAKDRRPAAFSCSIDSGQHPLVRGCDACAQPADDPADATRGFLASKAERSWVVANLVYDVREGSGALVGWTQALVARVRDRRAGNQKRRRDVRIPAEHAAAVNPDGRSSLRDSAKPGQHPEYHPGVRRMMSVRAQSSGLLHRRRADRVFDGESQNGRFHRGCSQVERADEVSAIAEMDRCLGEVEFHAPFGVRQTGQRVRVERFGRQVGEVCSHLLSPLMQRAHAQFGQAREEAELMNGSSCERTTRIRSLRPWKGRPFSPTAYVATVMRLARRGSGASLLTSRLQVTD
ncbi:hypothetical protein [Yinghuangia sp. YIM S10712]|uniref:hypothetical protein n=1 Tax=Yinghuangia sp. YIM S10712 TaxID=3436930 RepID=UPI003F53C151